MVRSGAALRMLQATYEVLTEAALSGAYSARSLYIATSYPHGPRWNKSIMQRGRLGMGQRVRHILDRSPCSVDGHHSS